MKKREESVLIVISGPSGVGKQTIAQELLKLMPELKVSVSATTRPPRNGEREGKDYFFLSEEEFKRRVKEGFFIECAEIHDNLYGTPVDNIREALNKCENLLLIVDIQGGKKVKEAFPENTLLFFVEPPSFSDLEERLRKRGSETEEEVRKRLNTAMVELFNHNWYDYIVVNDNPEKAALEIKNHVLARREK